MLKIISNFLIWIVGFFVKEEKPKKKKQFKAKVSRLLFTEVLDHFSPGTHNVGKLYNDYVSCVQKFNIKNEYFFLAQICHESFFFKYKYENLNYSVEGLMKVFPKYFPSNRIAAKYAKNPKKIANKVYANRMGNRDEQSGDGWRNRAFGWIGLTGKDNHENFRRDVKECHKEAIEDNWLAWLVSGWFWQKNKLDKIEDFKALTRKINGGYNGLKHRQEILRYILSASSKT